jgi:transcriptional regulator with XRE-family HTH domain
LIAVLRRAVNESGLSVNRIATESGISQSSLSRFMAGDRMLSLESASKLFDYLGLVAKKPAPKKPKH